VLLDERNNNREFAAFWNEASFPVANPVKCRLIRLTMTDVSHVGMNLLLMRGVEFFGTLFE
jgi:hypothetical protein